MLSNLLFAWSVMALCVASHAIGVTWAMRGLRRVNVDSRRFWPATWIFIRLAGRIVIVHLIQIALWSLLYVWQRALPDLTSALYFSAVTYTTTGYGDIVLPSEWRLVGAVEALTGILMCGWSTGFFFAVVSRLLQVQPERTPGALRAPQ